MKQGKREHDWLIVDGYNVIGNWQDMRGLANEDLESARDRLADCLIDYCGYSGQTLVLVFDAHGTNHMQKNRAVSAGGEAQHRIIFTSRGQTADNYIERFVREHSGEKMSVVSSDALVQVMIFAHAARVSSRELRNLIELSRKDVQEKMKSQLAQKQGLSGALREDEFKELNSLRYRGRKRKR